MNPIPVLGIPHYNRPDLLLRCVKSIDYPVKHLVIVANGLPSETPPDFVLRDTADRNLVENVRVITHPNAGVAGAWNEIIKLFPGTSPRPSPQSGEGENHWWLIANNDIEFAPGDLAKMSGFRSQNPEAGMVYGNHGASWFAITAHAIATAGLFDENIFPAYLEDCDMSRRFDLLGLRRCDVPDVHARHGDDKFSGSATIMSDAGLRKKNHRTHGGNFDYYRLKWGGINEQETFKTPFNQLDWPVWAWKFDPAMRAKQQW